MNGVEVRVISEVSVRNAGSDQRRIVGQRRQSNLRRCLTLLAMSYPDTLSADYARDNMCVGSRQRLAEVVSTLRTDLRELLGLSERHEPVPYHADTYCLDLGTELAVDYRKFCEAVHEANAISDYTRSVRDLERKWSFLETAVSHLPADSHQLLPGLNGLLNEAALREGFEDEIRQVTMSCGRIGLRMGPEFATRAAQRVGKLFRSRPIDDAVAQLYAKLQCAADGGPSGGLEVLETHTRALNEEGLRRTRGATGLYDALRRGDLAFLDYVTEALPVPRPPQGRDRKVTEVALEVRLPTHLLRRPQEAGASLLRPGLDNEWLQIAYEDLVIEHEEPYSIEWVSCRAQSEGEYRAEFRRTWPDDLESSWSSLLSDGGGIVYGLYGATGPQGGFGMIRLSFIRSGLYAGFYAPEEPSRSETTIRFSSRPGALLWVHPASDIASEYLDRIAQTPLERLRESLPDDVFTQLAKALASRHEQPDT